MMTAFMTTAMNGVSLHFRMQHAKLKSFVNT